MVLCPRCGAVNEAGRHACWQCWSHLPPVHSAETDQRLTPAEQPPAAHTPASHDVDCPASENPLIREAPAIAVSPDKSSTALQEKSSQALPPMADDIPEKGFTFIAEEIPDDAPPRGGMIWRVLALTLTLSVIVVSLIWFLTFKRSPRFASPGEAAQNYCAAIMLQDVYTQQTLATEDTKSSFFPSWYSVVRAQTVGIPRITGGASTVEADFFLSVDEANITLDPKLSEALDGKNAVHITLRLRRQRTGWCVDQRLVISDLYAAIKARCPEAKLPAEE